MADLPRLELLHAAQDEIVILRTFEPFAEAADLAHQLGPVKAEVIDEILSEKKFRVPIGLEIGAGTRAGLVNFVLVGIDQAGVGMPIEFERELGERVFRQEIILVEQRAPGAGRELQRGIGAGRDVAVLLAESQLDPRLVRGRAAPAVCRTSGLSDASSARHSSQRS